MANYIDIADINGVSLAEAAISAKEETKKLAAKNHIPDQKLLEDRDMARGYELEPNDFIARLQKLTSKVLIRQGGVRNAVAVCVQVPVSEDYPTGWKYITGFYINQRLPEFSSVTTDQFGVAHKEIRGWRSVLLALINAGAVDRRKADIAFGPALGQRTDLWYRSLQATGK